MLQVSLGEVVIPYWEMMPPSYGIDGWKRLV